MRGVGATVCSNIGKFRKLALCIPGLYFFYLGVRGRGVEIEVKGTLDKGEHARAQRVVV
jgi:hypothetical protein